MKIENFLCAHLYSSYFEKGCLRKAIPLLCVLFFLGGCSHHYVPDPSTFKLDSIIEFTSSKSIALVNAQQSTEEVLFATNAGHRFYGNLQAWTDTAIEITEKELANRGMSVGQGAQKKLKISIETVNGTVGFWVMRCVITLKVETSEGYVRTYSGDNRSPASIYRAVDGAVMRAVAEMLRDEKIISYLKR